MNQWVIIRYLKIFFASLAMFYVASYISVNFVSLNTISGIYFQLAIGIFLIYRYGPLIILSLYVNTAIFSYFHWGHPIYAVPILATADSVFIFFSWYFYIKLAKENPQIPSVASLLIYLIFGISLPLLFHLVYLNLLLINVINYVSGPFWKVILTSFLVDLSTVLAVTTTLLYFLYDFRFNVQDFKNIFVKKLQIRRNEFIVVFALLLALLILLSIYFNFSKYWYLYGILLLIPSLKYGFGISVLFNFILYIVVYILPSIQFLDPQSLKTDTIYFVEIFYGISFLSIFSLILGRSVSDKKGLLSMEKHLVNNLQSTNKSLAEAKTYFTRIFESSPNLIGIVRANDGSVIDINEEGLKMLNIELYHSTDNTLNVLDFISSDAWTQIKHCQDLNTRQFEFEVKRQGKPAVLCEVTAREFAISDEVHLLINATDISEKRAAEKQIEKANLEKIALNKKIAEFRMMALRSAMSPHFIFNCLNSIQFFILKNNKKEAVHYLTIFSKLVRNVLNISTKSMVTLEVEMDIVRYYIALEQMRFDNKFEAVFDIDKTVDMEDTEIPPLLIQPYVENAILHGLSHKQGLGLLKISIRDEGEYLKCVIEDDGVGRDYTRIMKEKKPQVLTHRSKGMSMTQERLELLNSDEIEGVKITDLKDGQNKPIGTRVEIYISVE